jgi:hypothetical protein
MQAENNKGRGFECKNCRAWVSSTNLIGSKNRNHCPICLWSMHIDDKVPGDRNSNCKGMMEPIALTFKQEGFDKFGKKKQGELMIIHQCQKCNKISINRIAGDDNVDKILRLFENQISFVKKYNNLLRKYNITPLTRINEKDIKTQLFGK